MAGFGVSCYEVCYSQLFLLCFLQQGLYGVKKMGKLCKEV